MRPGSNGSSAVRRRRPFWRAATSACGRPRIMVLDAAGDRRRKHADPPGRLRRRRAGRALAVRDRGRRDRRRARGAGLRPARACEASSSARSTGRSSPRWSPSSRPSTPAMCERYLDGALPDRRARASSTGMPIRLDNPRELGADRLVNAVAAYERFGGPCAVVDFGTAITFDVVSAEGEYLGGVIGPGRGDLDGGARGAGREAAADRARRAPRRARRGDRQDHPGEPPVGDRLRLRRGGRRDRPPRAARARRRGAVRRHGRPCRGDRPLLRDDRRGRRPADADRPAPDLGEEPVDAACRSTTPFRIGDVTVSNRVLLAPLAGIGNWFVRLQARRHGAGLAVSEMVSSFGLHHRNERTIARAAAHPPGRAPGLDPAVRPRPGRDALGGRDRRRGRRRPDRHQHGLPGAQGLQDGRRRGAAARPRPRRCARAGRGRGLAAAR